MRVQEPPPKRKKIEYRPLDSASGKPMTYQEAFMCFLANCGDETHHSSSLDPSSSATRKHPRDKIYQNFFANSTLAGMKTVPISTTTTIATTNSSQNPSFASISSQSASSQINGGLANSNSTTTHLDKENYYNSSRRENLTPLNSCEYRNSYKDVYDNQGVRVNPAIIKSLQAAASVASSCTAGANVASSSSLSKSSCSSSISKSMNLANHIGDKIEEGVIVTANILSDHTYRTTISQSKQQKNASALTDSSKIDTKIAANDSSGSEVRVVSSNNTSAMDHSVVLRVKIAILK